MDRGCPLAARITINMTSSSLKCLTPRCGSWWVQDRRLGVVIRAATASRNLQLGQTFGGHLLVPETNRKTRRLENCATFLTWRRWTVGQKSMSQPSVPDSKRRRHIQVTREAAAPQFARWKQ